MCTRCGIILQQRVFFLHSCRPPGARLASHFLRTGSGFAYGNGNHRLCGQAYANRVGRQAAFSGLHGSGFAY